MSATAAKAFSPEPVIIIHPTLWISLKYLQYNLYVCMCMYVHVYMYMYERMCMDGVFYVCLCTCMEVYVCVKSCPVFYSDNHTLEMSVI